ncbi:MAG: DUF1893 domain-containing protein [Syntrophaceae bacterium]
MSFSFNPDKTDFSRYSLALFSEGNVVFASTHSGLQPLILCVYSCKDLYTDCVLHDKAIGFAAARLLAYSGIASLVRTRVISAPARHLLSRQGMEIHAEQEVENFLTRDGLRLSPMEERALKAADNEAFYREMERLFRPK